MKNKLGIFTALILSLIIAGSAFASPGTAVSLKNPPKLSAKADKAMAKKKRKHHHRRKWGKMKKTIKTTKTRTVTPKKDK